MNIGLSQRILHYNNTAYDCLEHGWHSLLSNHTLFSIPNILEVDHKETVRACDLIVFTGGDASAMRTITETRLLTECYQQNTAVLGVCHGALFINQLEGGANTECENHSGTQHSVTLDGAKQMVNSYHSFAIEQLASKLVPTGWADDKSIESFKHQALNVWGLIWHPERMKEPVLPMDLRRFLNERND